jgi:hypothetical protein
VVQGTLVVLVFLVFPLLLFDRAVLKVLQVLMGQAHRVLPYLPVAPVLLGDHFHPLVLEHPEVLQVQHHPVVQEFLGLPVVLVVQVLHAVLGFLAVLMVLAALVVQILLLALEVLGLH